LDRCVRGPRCSNALDLGNTLLDVGANGGRDTCDGLFFVWAFLFFRLFGLAVIVVIVVDVVKLFSSLLKLNCSPIVVKRRGGTHIDGEGELGAMGGVDAEDNSVGLLFVLFLPLCSCWWWWWWWWCLGLVWFGLGLVWFGLVWFGLVWFGLVWFGLVWFGLVWFGLVWFGLVWFGLIWFDLV
jgi:hypothetical protein